MDRNSYKDLLGQVYELEGLLHVTLRSEGDEEMLHEMMCDKVELIAAMLNADDDDADAVEEAAAIADEAEVIADLEPNVEPEPETEEMAEAEMEAEAEVEEAAAMVEEEQLQIEDEAKEIEAELAEAAAMVEEEQLQIEDEAKEIEAELVEAEAELDEVECENQTQHDSPEEIGVMTFEFEEPVKVEDSIEEPEPEAIVKEEVVEEPAPKRAITEEPEEEIVTVDALFQRNMSKDLKKAFSINDRFRYKRELFGNSDVEMNDAINTVEAMKSYAEAEEYFYEILGWEEESPEVIDFMNVIKNHFHGK